MLKRILLSLVLAASVGGALAACNNTNATQSPAASIAAPSVEASAPAAGSPSEAAPSLEASPSSS
jgi:hypothetical protein